MKKAFRWLITLMCMACICIVGSTITVANTRNVKDALDNGEVKMMPTVDFVQPYMFAHDENNNLFDYETYFNDLTELGYEAIIIQFTRSEEYDGSSSVFYKTKLDDTEEGRNEFVGKVNTLADSTNYSYIMDELVAACETYDFEYYIGLSVEEYSWWALTCYYDEAYMNHCAETDAFMIKELYDKYHNKTNFVGWYFAYELFSNPIGWENLWANNINTVIAKINEVEANDPVKRPLMLSPFRQIILGNVTNEYRMWKNFFEKVNFRSGDIFCPQDSIGKLPNDDISFKKIYNYLDAMKKAIDEQNKGIKYWVNCELFITPDESAHLYVSDAVRVERQIKNASRVAEKLVTFSASHYLLEQGTVDTLENRNAFRNGYKQILAAYLN